MANEKSQNGTVQERPAGGGSDVEKGGKPQRDTWSNPADFVLSCLGYAVGLGNIWRFPWLCFNNGGGAFLIPYVLCLLFIGLPVFFMELIMGQYSGQGPLTVWKCAPLFKGIGAAMVCITSLFCVFYTMILGYSFYYLFASFSSLLPWDTCKSWFNSDFCFNLREAEPCTTINGTYFNQTCYNDTHLAADPELAHNILLYKANKSVSSSEEYLNHGLLEMTNAIDDFGGFKWQLVLVLLLSWIVCFLCLFKGIKSAGKVVYFTAIFPYVVITILLIWAATLPGSRDGVIFYIKPDFSKLANAQVWGDAAGQIFFSLSVGSGGLMTFASYNKFRNNIYRDALIVSFGNCLTSFYAGFAIFSILGNMAHVLGKEVKDVAVEGSTLAFVAYPQVVATMPVPQLWSTLFFLMLITLGLDSLFAGMETVVTAIVDTFPSLWKKKTLVTGILCFLFFLIGLPMTTRAGIYWMNLIAYYSSGWCLIVIGLFELAAFSWFYGASKVRRHVQTMTGYKLWPHWLVLWYGLSPVLLAAILIMNWIQFKPLTFGPYILPEWAQALGWLIATSPIILIVVGAIAVLIRSYGQQQYRGLGFIKRIHRLLQPTEEWGPSDPDVREVTTSSYDITRAEKESPQNTNSIGNGMGHIHQNPAFVKETS